MNVYLFKSRSVNFNYITALVCREEFDAKAVRSTRRGIRHHQAVLPRRRKWVEEDVLREESGAAIPEIRPQFVHADY